MTSSEDVGARLLVAQIDKLAADTSRIWASIPVDDESLSKGFQDVTYTAFANAINRAAIWLHNKLPAAVQQFETVAYCGPKDIRYPILAVAVAKVGRKVLPFKCYLRITKQVLSMDSYFCLHFSHLSRLKPTLYKLRRAESLFMTNLTLTWLTMCCQRQRTSRYHHLRLRYYQIFSTRDLRHLSYMESPGSKLKMIHG